MLVCTRHACSYLMTKFFAGGTERLVECLSFDVVSWEPWANTGSKRPTGCGLETGRVGENRQQVFKFKGDDGTVGTSGNDLLKVPLYGQLTQNEFGK